MRKFPRRDQEAITNAIDAMIDNPHIGDVEKMKGQNTTWRRRVGSYRIKFDVYPDLRTIVVFKLERRTSTTY